MTNEVIWTKIVLERFIEQANLSEDEEIVMRTRAAGWSRTKQAMELNLSVSTIDRIISNHPCKSLSSALKSKRTNCATFISFGLQEIGVLPKGKYIWLDTKIHGTGKNIIKKKAKIAYPRKKWKQAKLKPGDICGFAHKPHTMVYVGKDKKPDTYGKAIAKGICAYLGVTFKEGSKPKPKDTYRVRKTWKDAKSQKGAFSSLENAKKCADKYGYSVFNSKGKAVYRGKK